MKCKYEIMGLIESLDFTKDYINKNAMKETLCYIVEKLKLQVQISQNEMNYEERFSHNWSDYEAARAVRNFCQEFLNDLGIE